MYKREVLSLRRKWRQEEEEQSERITWLGQCRTRKYQCQRGFAQGRRTEQDVATKESLAAIEAEIPIVKLAVSEIVVESPKAEEENDIRVIQEQKQLTLQRP